MPEREIIELRSDDVQEILGTPPHWLVQWGTAVVFAGFAAMLLTAWFVRYPDVVGAKVVITTSVPPVDIVARTEGRISDLFARDRQEVKTGELLAVIQSTANFRDVLTLDTLLGVWQSASVEALKQAPLPIDLDLGEIQAEYTNFLQQLERFKFGKSNRNASTRSNIGSINQQIAQIEKTVDFEEKTLRRVERQLGLAQETFEAQKKLYEQGLISKVEFEKERNRVLDFENQRDQMEGNILRRQNEIITLRKGITDATFNQQESASTTSTNLQGSLSALRSSVDRWKQSYLLTAPIDGQIALHTAFASAQQYVRQGEQVLTVVPPSSNQIFGRLSLPIAGSGKVKKDQAVIIKLDNYPYHEFGSIKGKVDSKSLIPKDNQYSISVKLEDGLKTSHNRTIEFEQQLQGKAEIITENKGFLQRIAEQVFAKKY
jgi:multidrug resistance efflux pump